MAHHSFELMSGHLADLEGEKHEFHFRLEINSKSIFNSIFFLLLYEKLTFFSS